MGDTQWMSKRQERLMDGLNAFAKLTPEHKDDKYPFLTESFEGLLDATLRFSDSEFDYRQAERYALFKMDKNLQNFHLERARSLNERGLKSLKEAMSSVKDLGTVLDDYPEVKLSQDSQDAKDLKNEFYRSLVELDTKTTDIEELKGAFDEAFDAVVDGQMEGLQNFLEKKYATLVEMRESKSRGTESNINPWKVVAIAAFLGISLHYLMRCRWRWFGRVCTYNTRNYYAALAAIAAAGVKLC